MMDLVANILNNVVPVFLVIGLGILVRSLGLVDAAFVAKANKLVFNVCLPLLLFKEIGSADFFASFNARLLGISVGVVLFAALGAYLFAGFLRYPAERKGVFCQGSFRGNLAYVGLALILNTSGAEAMARASILMGFLVLLFNVLSIFVLLLPFRAEAGSEASPRSWGREIFLNPLIIAALSGILWSLSGLHLPIVLDRGLGIATGMTLPLALLSIGASLSSESLKEDFGPAFLVSLTKLLWMPLLAWGGLALVGVRGVDLEIGVIFAGTPAATANYVMASQMRGDAGFAGSIVTISTALSALTSVALLLALKLTGN